jgi:hypothetical protein
MFEKMGQTMFFCMLMAGACAHPYAARCSRNMFHRFGYYPNPASKCCEFHSLG